MNKKLIISVLAAGCLTSSYLVAATTTKKVSLKASTDTSTELTMPSEVFDPFALTTVTVTATEITPSHHKPDHPIPPGHSKPPKTPKKPPKPPRP